jgi:uncharacterized phage infection (PIP) family protein YhgE
MEDKFYREVSDSMKLMYDLTSRIDERVKNLVETQSETNDRMDKLMERQEGIMSRLSVLENKNGVHKDIAKIEEDIKELQKGITSMGRLHQQEVINNGQLQQRIIMLEASNSSNVDKWRNVFAMISNIIVIVFGGIILWKLGIKP